MTDKLNNDITDSYKKHIKDRLDFLKQKEEELKNRLEEGKTKESKIIDKLREIKGKVEKTIQKEMMEGNFSSDQIKKRLEELDILENQEKEKLETLRSQKKSEIKENIDNKALEITEEEKKLMEVFKDKTPEEVKKMLKREKNKPKMKKLFHKIRKTALILGVTTGLSLAIYNYAINDAKKRANEKTEEAIKKGNQQDSIATLQPKITITPEILKQQIKPEQLGKGISYENVSTVVNNILNKEIREQVINLLKNGKIVEAQEIFGMKKDSKYISNKATGKIDVNTLQKFSDQYFGLYGKEILAHKDIPQDVKDAYQKFLLGEIDNNGVDYIIISKTDFHMYLFTKDHKLLHRTKKPTGLGEDIENNGKWLPYPYYKTNKGVIYHNQPVNTDTPEGFFKTTKTVKLATNYICDGPKTGIVLTPIDIKTQKIDTTRYEYIKKNNKFISTINMYNLEIHPVYQPPEDADKYENAINSPEIDDNTISHGCINTDEIGIFIDNTSKDNIVYITHK